MTTEERKERGRILARKWAKEHPERHAASARKWNKNNRRKKNEIENRWRNKHPEAVKRHMLRAQLKHSYGITPEDYEKMLEAQGHRCAICGTMENGKSRWPGVRRKLCVDHDHSTGKVRGLLCSSCNLTLGIVEAEWKIKKCAEYLGLELRLLKAPEQA